LKFIAYLYGKIPQHVSQSNCGKIGRLTHTNFNPGPTVLLFIATLIEIASLLLSRAGGLLVAYN